MLNKVFSKDNQEAEITIKVGDYVMTVKGEIEPPTVKTDRFESDIYGFGYKGATVIPDVKELLFKVRPKSNLVAEQWRWTIPLATPPRIEEE